MPRRSVSMEDPGDLPPSPNPRRLRQDDQECLSLPDPGILQEKQQEQEQKLEEWQHAANNDQQQNPSQKDPTNDAELIQPEKQPNVNPMPNGNTQTHFRPRLLGTSFDHGDDSDSDLRLSERPGAVRVGGIFASDEPSLPYTVTDTETTATEPLAGEVTSSMLGTVVAELAPDTDDLEEENRRLNRQLQEVANAEIVAVESNNNSVNNISTGDDDKMFQINISKQKAFRIAAVVLLLVILGAVVGAVLGTANRGGDANKESNNVQGESNNLDAGESLAETEKPTTSPSVPPSPFSLSPSFMTSPPSTTTAPSSPPIETKPVGGGSPNPTSSAPSPEPTNPPISISNKPTSFTSVSPTTSMEPTSAPTKLPSQTPTKAPTSPKPTFMPSKEPTTNSPITSPPVTSQPSFSPTRRPTTSRPTKAPSPSPTTMKPTAPPTKQPSMSPTKSPTMSPTKQPTTPSPTPSRPTTRQSSTPTVVSSSNPSLTPTTMAPTAFPTKAPVMDFNSAQWVQLGSDLDGDIRNDKFGASVQFSSNGQRMAVGTPYTPSASYVRVFDWNDGSSQWQQVGSDIIEQSSDELFGFSVSMNSDGTRLVVGGDHNDAQGGNRRGVVRVYEYESNDWVQVGDDMIGSNRGDDLGYSVDMSADGNRIVVGAPYGSVSYVRVLEWTGSNWVQVGSDIEEEESNSFNGWFVSISADGDRIVMGAPTFDSNNGDHSGQVRVFRWNNGAGRWEPMGSAFIGDGEGDWYGYAVSMTADGNRFVAAAPYGGVGYLRVYDWNGLVWEQVGSTIFGAQSGDEFGFAVDISPISGDRIVAGGRAGNQVRAFGWNAATGDWEQIGSALDGESSGDIFGYCLTISADGNRIAAGSISNDNGNGDNAGHIRAFEVVA